MPDQERMDGIFDDVRDHATPFEAPPFESEFSATAASSATAAGSPAEGTEAPAASSETTPTAAATGNANDDASATAASSATPKSTSPYPENEAVEIDSDEAYMEAISIEEDGIPLRKRGRAGISDSQRFKLFLNPDQGADGEREADPEESRGAGMGTGEDEAAPEKTVSDEPAAIEPETPGTGPVATEEPAAADEIPGAGEADPGKPKTPYAVGSAAPTDDELDALLDSVPIKSATSEPTPPPGQAIPSTPAGKSGAGVELPVEGEDALVSILRVPGPARMMPYVFALLLFLTLALLFLLGPFPPPPYPTF